MREILHTITDKYDLAAKPALDIIRLAGQHKCRTYVAKNDYVTDIDKLFIMLSYNAKEGDTIRFITDGVDENTAIEEIGSYVSANM